MKYLFPSRFIVQGLEFFPDSEHVSLTQEANMAFDKLKAIFTRNKVTSTGESESSSEERAGYEVSGGKPWGKISLSVIGVYLLVCIIAGFIFSFTKSMWVSWVSDECTESGNNFGP